MKLSLMPFIDMFSILSIGFLILLSIASGTPGPDTSGSENASYAIVRIALPELTREGVPASKRIHLDPYFVKHGANLVYFDEYYTKRVHDGLEVLIWGDVAETSIAIRVKAVIDPLLYGETGKLIMQLISSQEDAAQVEQTYAYHIGNWIDPVLDLSR